MGCPNGSGAHLPPSSPLAGRASRFFLRSLGAQKFAAGHSPRLIGARRGVAHNRYWFYLTVSLGLLAAATYIAAHAGAENVLRVATRYSLGSLLLIVVAFVVSLLGACRLQALVKDLGYPSGWSRVFVRLP